MRCGSIALVIIGAVMALGLTGCGGSSSTPSSGTGTGVTYVTDSASSLYSSVLVTLYEVEVGSNGTYTPIFKSTSGIQLNLATLSGLDEFLNAAMGVSIGTYNTVRVTVGNTVTVTPTNSTTSTALTLGPSVGTPVGSNEVQIVYTLPSPIQVTNGGIGNIAVDFNLPGFVINGNTITSMPVQEQSDTSFQTASKSCRVYGMIFVATSLSSPYSFSMTSPNSTTPLTVTGTSSTLLVDLTNGTFGASATLQEGENIYVIGTFDPSTLTITASYIFILPAQATNGAGVAAVDGEVESVNTANNTFTVAIANMENMTLDSGVLTVGSASSTKYILVGTGLTSTASSFSSLQVGDKVAITGTSIGSTLIANSVLFSSGPIFQQ